MRPLGTPSNPRRSSSKSRSLTLFRLLGSATSLLAILSNPQNVTLLTSQLLSAPSIWHHPDSLRTTIHALSIFNSASIRLVQQKNKPSKPNDFGPRSSLKQEEWATAVVKGCDDNSPRWRHLCVFGGLLIGFEGRGEHHISSALRRTLEDATVKAVNMALTQGEVKSEFAANSIALVLSHAFDLLSDHERSKLNHDLLLPSLIHAAFYSREGLHLGFFLSTSDADIMQQGPSKFEWSPKSPTFVQYERLSTGPLMNSLGALSRLIATAVENVHVVDLLATMMTNLSAFTRSMCLQWSHNKLSEIDVTEEQTFLGDETLRTTLPSLWRTLRSALFALVIVLRSLLGRVLKDRGMSEDAVPFIAIQTLHILRDMYFVSSRTGANSFSQYSFVYLTAIDILSQYPVQVEAFLQEIRPNSQSEIPQHPLDRYLDLYFLNTAEHFAINLSPQRNDELLVEAATPYLGLAGDPRLLEIFEAAHSTMLAVLSAPQNATLLTRHLNAYVGTLFDVFPQNLSPRQFRMAVKTLVRITSPPAPIAHSQPMLPSTILELVRHRLENASSFPLPKTKQQQNAVQEEFASEQSVLILTLIDALPFLPLDQLEDWLPLVAESLNFISDPLQLHSCRQRFWQTLSNGEMDVGRASLCLNWWGSRGGRDAVMNGASANDEGPFMSGALIENGRL